MEKIIAHARKDKMTNHWIVHSLEEHLMESAELAGKFTAKIGLSQIGVLLGLLHDIGKYSFKFQCYIRSSVGMLCTTDQDFMDPNKFKGKIDHSTAGAQWICDLLQNDVKIGKLLKEVVALCGISHHSGLLDLLDISGEDKFSARITKDVSFTHFLEVKTKMDHSITGRITTILDSQKKNDQLRKITSQIYDLFKDPIRSFSMGLLTRFIFSCLVDADRISTADFDSPDEAKLRYLGKYPDWQELINCVEEKASEFGNKVGKNKVDQNRCDISSSCLRRAKDKQGLYYLTVPTGGGKTFSSLRFALHHAKEHKLDRIIYVIPYTSIIDQNASEVAKIFNAVSKNIVLEHHSNLVPDKDTRRNRMLSENWDAPIVFTTSVQLLESLFGGGTRSVRRMHQLAKSIIIFDEIQTLPIKTVHLFNNAINFLTDLCSSTVVFCTATQPLLHGVDPSKGAVPYAEELEIVDYPPFFKELKRVAVQDCFKDGGWTEDELAEKVRILLRDKGSVLVVTNTKPNAKRLYNSCQDICENVFHLSTDMCPKHRKEILAKIITCLDPSMPQPVICISTQLIEAGVDVDFSSVIRCFAGLDSIAQAAGRCNRNGLQKVGKVLVVNLNNENLDKLPEIKLAQDVTLRLFDEYRKDPDKFDNDRIGHKALKLFYEYYFFQRKEEMSYQLPREAIGRKDDILSLLSTNIESVAEYIRSHNGTKPPCYLWQSFKTAGKNFCVIDAPTVGIIVPFNDEAKSIITKLSSNLSAKEEAEQLKAAQQYSVNIFPWLEEKLEQQKALFKTHDGNGIWYLDEQYYSKDFGVSQEPVSPMAFLNA